MLCPQHKQHSDSETVSSVPEHVAQTNKTKWLQNISAAGFGGLQRPPPHALHTRDSCTYVSLTSDLEQGCIPTAPRRANAGPHPGEALQWNALAVQGLRPCLPMQGVWVPPWSGKKRRPKNQSIKQKHKTEAILQQIQ